MTDRRFRVTDARALLIPDAGDALDVGVLSLDHALVVTGWNEWLERMTGKRAADVVGRPLTEIEPNLRPSAIAALEQAVNGATVVLSHRLHGYLLDIPSPPGLEHLPRMQQNVRILPVAGNEPGNDGAVVLIQDVTERVVREAELRSAMEAAQSANRAKSNFLAAMSHELRTPIGAVSAYADLLVDGIFGDVAPEQREPLVRIKVVSEHLLGIVEQILTFARIEAGREVVQVADADAVRVMQEAITAVEPLVAKKSLTLSREFPTSPVPMRTDIVKLRQVLINLLGNAVKFTQRGSISVAVRIPTADVVAFSVADTGPGIALADQTRIFEPFVQASGSLNRTHEGTGLGLSVSRELVRLLGGDLTVRSELDAGSVFTAEIPRATPS
jgi:signal transduction histidine kinase